MITIKCYNVKTNNVFFTISNIYRIYTNYLMQFLFDDVYLHGTETDMYYVDVTFASLLKKMAITKLARFSNDMVKGSLK